MTINKLNISPKHDPITTHHHALKQNHTRKKEQPIQTVHQAYTNLQTELTQIKIGTVNIQKYNAPKSIIRPPNKSKQKEKR